MHVFFRLYTQYREKVLICTAAENEVLPPAGAAEPAFHFPCRQENEKDRTLKVAIAARERT